MSSLRSSNWSIMKPKFTSEDYEVFPYHHSATNHNNTSHPNISHFEIIEMSKISDTGLQNLLKLL